MVLAEVRRLVQDEREPLRYSDTAIRHAARAAFDNFRMLRPDFVEGSIMQSLPAYPDTFPIHEAGTSAFNTMAAAYIMVQNEEYANDGTAANMMALALSMLRGAPR
jgi:hypothetical protein